MGTTTARPVEPLALARPSLGGLALGVAALLAATALAACNALWGVDDLGYGRGGSSGSTTTGGAGGGAVGGASGGTTTSSSSSEGGVGGEGTVENCLDGVDNDGNALADCDDPACMEYSCIPLDGSVVSIVALGGAPCPAPANSALWLTCTGCSCVASTEDCSMTLRSFLDGACGSVHNQASGPGCHNADPVAARWFTASVAGPWQTSCATNSPTEPAAVQSACELQAWGHCSNGDACVPASLAQSKSCVRVAPDASCPDAYPNRFMVQPNDLGENICTCDCGIVDQGCDAPSIDVFAGTSDCTGAPTQLDVSTPCTSAGMVTSFEIPTVAGVVSCAAASELEQPIDPAIVCCAG